MTNINLVTEDVSKEKSSFSDRGSILGLIVLILVLALYGGILFYKKRVTSEIVQIKGEYDQKYNSILAGQAKAVADFQNKLTAAGKLVKQGKNMSENFNIIEKALLPSVYLDSYRYDDKNSTITISCVGDNYNIVAKQIMAFKNSDYFSEVVSGKTSFDSKENKINFEIGLKLNN